MYLPMQIPKLRADLAQRLYPLCERLRVPMDQFVNEAVAQAVARAEAGLEGEGAGLVKEEAAPGPA
jgi:predicted transcriptional regulator